MSLSLPLELKQSTIDEKIKFVVENFSEKFLKQENRPLFKGKPIYFEMSKEHHHMVHPYPEKLMHIISLEDKGVKEILPCINDFSSLICQNKCSLRNALLDFQLLQRQECFYRMSRIHWIPEIIELANSNYSHIKVWEEHTLNSKRKKITKTFIRYQEGLIDYVIILAHRKKDGQLVNYIFETAFPLFYERTKKQYDRSFNANT